MQLMTFVIVLGVAIAIFLTTSTGRRIGARFGMRFGMEDPAPDKDREYLLQVCDGDLSAVESMLAEARHRRPEMTEREAYRAAIRSHLRDKI